MCAILLLLAVVLLFRELGGASFHDADEAMYAQVALEMTTAGEWLTPLYWDEPLLHKPPLGFWLIGLAHRCLPTSSPEFYARLPSALSALLLIALVYWTTRRMAGVAAAACAALALLGNGQFLYEHCARSANLDAPVTLLCFSALVFGARAHVHTRDRFLSAVALAGIALLKAPLAVFAFVPVLAYQLAHGRRWALKWLAWVAGAMLVLPLPWHLYQLYAHGSRFWDTYVMFEIFGRAGATASAYSNRPLIHLEALWRSFLPWSPLLLLGTLAALVWWPNKTDDSTRHTRGVCRLLAGFSVLYLGTLCAISAKWPWYAILAYPTAVVVAATMAGEVARSRWSALLPPVLALAAASRILLLDPVAEYAPAARKSMLWPGASAMLRPPEGPWSASEMIAALTLITAGALVTIPAFRRSRRRTAGLAGVISIAILAIGIRTVAAVPVHYVSAVHDLARTLSQQQVDRVFLLGFHHGTRHGGRMEEFSTAYLRNIDGATVVDCRQNLGSVVPDVGRSNVLVIHQDGFGRFSRDPRLRELVDRPDLAVWLLNRRAAQRLTAPR